MCPICLGGCSCLKSLGNIEGGKCPQSALLCAPCAPRSGACSDRHEKTAPRTPRLTRRPSRAHYSGVIRVPLDDLDPSPRNPRRHDLPAIEASIARFVGAVVVDSSKRRVLAGHGRVAALRRLRASGAACPRGAEGWTVPSVVAPLAGLDAEALLLADNRTNERASWERDGLAEILADLADADALAGTGYTDADVASLIAKLTAEPPPTLEPEPEPEPDTIESTHTLALVYSASEWPRALDALARAVERIGGGSYSAAILAALESYGAR